MVNGCGEIRTKKWDFVVVEMKNASPTALISFVGKNDVLDAQKSAAISQNVNKTNNSI